MGSLALREKLLLYPAKRVRALRPGSVGVVFQSGGTFQFWLQQASMRGLDFSYAVSSGNELDLDLADYISFLVDDEHTRIIACLVEGIRRPQAFMAAAEKALEARKPIVLVKVGRSERGKAAAASHTGAIAGDDAVFDAVCRKYGIVRVPSLDDLIETCLAFAQGRLPKGPRIAMACYSGGAKGLILDYASDEGAEMAPLTPETKAKLLGMIDPGLAAENPLDVGPTVGVQAAKFAEICKVVCADPTVDLVTVQGLVPVNPDDPYNPEPLKSVAASTDKPVLAFGRIAQNASETSRKFQSETGVPFIQGLPETVRALARAGALRGGAAARRHGVARAARRREQLDGAAFDTLLAANGLTPPRSALAKTPEDAAAKAAAIGFPVAVKIVSPQASHKTEVGGVALASRTRTRCARRRRHGGAARRARSEARRRRLPGPGDGRRPGDDPGRARGPAVRAVHGGRPRRRDGRGPQRRGDPPPADRRGNGAGHAPLAARRRPARRVPRPPAARHRGVVQAMTGLSRMFIDHRDALSDIEINPMIVLAEGQGVRAVDVRTVARGARQEPNA